MKQGLIIKGTVVFLFCLILLFSICLISCGKDEIEDLPVYQVSFKSAGLIVDTKDVVEGQFVSEPESPTRDGYRFVGWEDSDGNEFSFDTAITKNMTLTAVFEMYRFHVNFVVGDSIYRQRTINGGETISSIEAPTKTNYRFVGWYKDGSPYDFETPIEEDLSLEATYELLPVEERYFTVASYVGNTKIMDQSVRGGQDALIYLSAVGGSLYKVTDVDAAKNITQDKKLTYAPTGYASISLDTSSSAFKATYQGKVENMGSDGHTFYQENSKITFTANFEHLIGLTFNAPSDGISMVFHISIDGVEHNTRTVASSDLSEEKSITTLVSNIEAGSHTVSIWVTDVTSSEGELSETNGLTYKDLYLWVK